MTRITQSDLILPALYVIYKQPGIRTGELIVELRSIFNPTGEDAELSPGRSDDRFSQIVRNLVSHDVLNGPLGYTVLNKSGETNTTHNITEVGVNYLKENISALESLLSNEVGYIETIDGVGQIVKAQATGRQLVVYDENIFVSEGRKKTVTSQVYERSKILRDKAVDYYTNNGKIICKACGFDFYEIYGEVGKGYIEIHHQKPIFQYEESDFDQLITDALKDLTPLCANCHKIVHRKKGKPLSMDELLVALKK